MRIIDGYYGLGILSKYPILEISSDLLPNGLFKELWILTNTKIGFEKIDVYYTYLTYENNDIRKYTDGIKSVNSDQGYMTFRNFEATDDIYYSKHFKLMERGLKESSFSDHDLLYGEFDVSD